MLRAIVPPLVATYAVFVAMVILAWRRPAPRPRWRQTPPAPTAGSTGSVLATASCGYVVFLVIVLVFHVWLAGESDALVSAAWGGSFLSLTALGASAFTTLVLPSLRGRKGRPSTAGPPSRGVGSERIAVGGEHMPMIWGLSKSAANYRPATLPELRCAECKFMFPRLAFGGCRYVRGVIRAGDFCDEFVPRRGQGPPASS